MFYGEHNRKQIKTNGVVGRTHKYIKLRLVNRSSKYLEENKITIELQHCLHC